MSNNDVSIKLPKGAVEGVIDAHIRAAVSEALGRDPERLIAAVVNRAMHEKEGGRNYGPTVFEAAINKEIRAVAHEEFLAWLEENRPKVRAQIRAKLKTVKLANLLVEGLAESIHVNVNLGRVV